MSQDAYRSRLASKKERRPGCVCWVLVSFGLGFQPACSQELEGTVPVVEAPPEFEEGSLAVDDAVPYLAYVDGGQTAAVLRLEGGTWRHVGQRGFAGDNIREVELQVHNHEPVVVVRRDYWRQDVHRYDRGRDVWQHLKWDFFGESEAGIDIFNGEPFVIGTDAKGEVQLYRHDGALWQLVGTAIPRAECNTPASLKLVNRIPLVACFNRREDDSRGTIAVFRLAEGWASDHEWESLGSPPDRHMSDVGYSSRTLSLVRVGGLPALVYRSRLPVGFHSYELNVWAYDAEGWRSLMSGVPAEVFPMDAAGRGEELFMALRRPNGHLATQVLVDGALTSFGKVMYEGFGAPSLALSETSVYVASRNGLYQWQR